MKRPRQLPLHVDREHGSPLPIDVIEFEVLTAELSDVAGRAFTRFVFWSWLHGPIPFSEIGRQSIARQVPRVFRAAWRELRPLFRRRRTGYVSPWLETLRAADLRKREIAANAGRASGRARRGGATTPAPIGAPRLLHRFTRPPATFELLAAFARKELWDRYDASDWPPSRPYRSIPDDELDREFAAGKTTAELCPRPTRIDLKEMSGRLFNWSDDPAIVDRAFDASEAAWERRTEDARGRRRRESELQQARRNRR